MSATKRDGVFVKTTETDRFRLVWLTTQAAASLPDHLDRAHDAAQTAGRSFDRSDLVFTNDPECQRPWRPELVTRRWERLRKQAGLDHVKIHGIRHFVATELPTARIDVRTVANRLGHTRTSTTLDTYWAWVPTRDRDAAQHLDAVLAAGQSGRQPIDSPPSVARGSSSGQGCGDLGAVGQAELAEDVADVGLHGGPTHDERLGDLRLGAAFGDQRGDLGFGGGEALPPHRWSSPFTSTSAG